MLFVHHTGTGSSCHQAFKTKGSGLAAWKIWCMYHIERFDVCITWKDLMCVSHRFDVVAVLKVFWVVTTHIQNSILLFILPKQDYPWHIVRKPIRTTQVDNIRSDFLSPGLWVHLEVFLYGAIDATPQDVVPNRRLCCHVRDVAWPAGRVLRTDKPPPQTWSSLEQADHPEIPAWYHPSH